MKRKGLLGLIGATAIVLFLAFTQNSGKKGYNKANLDKSAEPCQDFYTYAIGGWQKANPIPSTESRWSVFNILSKQNEERVEKILDDLLKSKENYAKGTVEQQVRDFYQSLMDTLSRDQFGTKPLESFLRGIDTSKTKEELMDLIASWQPLGIKPFFNIYVTADAKNSEMNAVHVSQGGLHLPDRDYYTNTDSANLAIQAAYFDHVTRMMGFLKNGEQDPAEEAQHIIMLESQLAANSMTRTERRDPDKTYNLITIEQFSHQYDGINWPSFFEKAGMPRFESIIVGQTDFLHTALDLYKSQPLDAWKSYFRWELLSHFSGVLSLEIEYAQHDFYSGTLKGTKEMKPLKERAVKSVNSQMGMLVGQLFVRKHFTESSKKQVSQMVEEIREVFRERINQLTWMSPETKRKAIEKLNAFKYKIGYPDKWDNYFTMDISSKDLFSNVISIQNFSYEKMKSKVGQPVDKSEWGMSPQTVNAYYSASKNEIVFPAGILQAPFFDPNADPALNYGGIGAVIGHEFSHGFDDKGSKFDAFGNLNNWWTENDRNQFNELTMRIVEQFNRYEVLPQVNINGSLTQGENIADLAGLTLAYYALNKHYGANAPKGKGSDGFTWQQRFFLGWAQVWAQNITEKELRNRIITDPHSPGQYRVIGPLSNMKEFWDAFGCQEGSLLRLDNEMQRVVIW